MERLSRRKVLAGLPVSASLSLAMSAAAAEQSQRPLKDIAAAHGILYGCAASVSQLIASDPFTDLLTREVALLVPENEMKWSHMSTTPFQTDFRATDYFVDFATRRDLRCRGHNLLWFASTPRWFLELADRRRARLAMIQRVTDLVGRYRGKIDSWDVVNEAVEPADNRSDRLRAAVFIEKVGPEYLEEAYFAARAADPGARLVLNEYDVEYDTPYHEHRRTALLDVLENMRNRGVPIDALGIEAHLSAGLYAFSGNKLRGSLGAVAAMGLEIQITELDCTDEIAPADIVARDRAVGDEYRRFLDVVLDEPAVKLVNTWGLSDRHSWIVRHEVKPARCRWDGTEERPLPFDRDLLRKPAWYALAEAFARSPARNWRG